MPPLALEEAYLTLVGVTMGQPVMHETLVVDIGGGSTEFCAVAAGGHHVHGHLGDRVCEARLSYRKHGAINLLTEPALASQPD